MKTSLRSVVSLGLCVAVLSACGSTPDAPRPPSQRTEADASTPDVPSVVDVSSRDAVVDVPASDDAPSVVDVPAVVDVLARDAATPSDVPDDAPPCGPGYTCPSGYRCVGLSTVRCVRTAALGEPCRNSGDDPIYCPPAATCEPVEGVPRCVLIGARDGLCHNDCRAPCERGLGCDPGFHCRPGLAPGALCGGAGDFCNAGSACIDVDGTRRCIADGTDGGHCIWELTCAAGLSCRGASVGGCSHTSYHCTSTLLSGDVCTPTGTPCATGTTCAMSAGVLRCMASDEGRLGGRCRQESPRCDDGMTCRDGWTCARLASRGMTCAPSGGSVVCADGDTCTTEHRADLGRCVAAGTAPGADCRATEPPCDGALQCSDFSRYRRTCRTVAAEGDPCDLGAIQTLCPSGTRCLPTTVSPEGRAVANCVAPTPETEPNDRVTPSRAALTRSALYASSLSVDDREDCHLVRVPSGGALYVEASAVLDARLLRSSGEEIGRWTLTATSWGGPLGGLARLDPAAIRVLRELSADDYQLCVREAGAASPRESPARFTLALGVLPRSW